MERSRASGEAEKLPTTLAHFSKKQLRKGGVHRRADTLYADDSTRVNNILNTTNRPQAFSSM